MMSVSGLVKCTLRRARAWCGRIHSRYRLVRRRGHAWLQSHPRLHDVLRVSGCLSRGTEAAARGVGVGLFVGLTPTVGVQTILMIIGCIILRGNFPIAFAVSWVSNPLTLAPLYWTFRSAGKAVYELTGVWFDSSPGDTLHGIANEVIMIATGGFVIAVPVAGLGYLLTQRLLAVLEKK